MRVDGGRWRAAARRLGVAAVVCAGAAWAEPAEKANDDDLTFRPTVLLRKGKGQGSGTVVASVAGDTLILTAAHVVREPGPVRVELHRYNMGVEQTLPVGGWPLTLPGEVAALDLAGDVAVVRVRGRPALPYVARLAAAGEEPDRGAAVVSVGIDHGTALQSWSTHVVGSSWFALADDGPATTAPRLVARRPRSGADALDPGDRPFLITVRPPEHGRSGGGLFLSGGRHALVGVCVGRVGSPPGKTVGLFASVETVRRLLRDHDLDAAVSRSESDRDRLKITPTHSRASGGAPEIRD